MRSIEKTTGRMLLCPHPPLLVGDGHVALFRKEQE